MKKYACTVCGYVYDEQKGMPETGIAPGTQWEDVKEDWVCPICGASKAEFKAQGGEAPPSKPMPVMHMDTPEDMKELSALEMSVLCSNLARGCEKQYKQEEASLFTALAAFFKAACAPVKAPDMAQLLTLVQSDLEQGIPAANTLSAAAMDRGAMRALVWNEKVTRILKSLLARYEKEGDAMLQNTGVYVCTICGFIYVGDNPPDLCPVCKVPGWKFQKVEGRE